MADVRSFPSSRRWPQFNQPNLESSLRDADVEYRWLKALGGRRSSKRTDSPHTAWEVPAFRAYADYADTSEFEMGLDELIAFAAATRTAYLCSEGLWWRCHRRIISDHLLVRGWDIAHIMPDGKLKMHAISPFARILNDRLFYDQIADEES